MKRVQDKVCIVTGGARGIGQAACGLLAKEGGKIAVTDVIDDEGQEVVDQISKAGGTAKYWHLDTSNESNVKSVMDEIFQTWGHLSVLVNNAGIAGVNAPPDEISYEDWQKVIDINVNGVFLCTKHAIPYMRRHQKGSIVNLSSIYGLVSAKDLPPYHASKGAVRLMSKTDALYYAEENIRVNSVHPGYIWTPLVEELGSRSEQGVEAFKKELASRHPVGRVGEPEDIAYAILYLASDESRFVTGSELVVDGGYTAR